MQLFNNVLPLLMLASGAIAEVYIISFENLETPDSWVFFWSTYLLTYQMMALPSY